MTKIYGHKWGAIAKSDDGTWLDGLRGFTPEQVAMGLGKLVTEFYEWPPSLPEFRRLCLDIDDFELENYIQKFALNGYTSFDRQRLTYTDIDKAVNRVKKRATKSFYDEKLNDNLERLEHDDG